jgi:hypothetical protein
VARLTKLDESARSGPEFGDPSQGVHILPDDAVALIDGEAGLAIDVDSGRLGMT